VEEAQFIECVAERDIDLLLLEELHVSAAFRSWLLGQTFAQDVCCTRFLGAWHSVSHPTLGESDLLLLFEDSQDTKTALLIENKIDALPQVEQAARYRLRGEVGRKDGSWAKFCTCITAPQAYLAGTSDAGAYEARVSYESLRDWFRQSGASDERSAYKARIVQEAIEQNRRGYRPTPHAAVTQFWLDYWQLASAEFPQLRMKRPAQIPAGSDWPEFRPPAVGSGRRIVHKLAIGAVDLEIASAGDMTEEIAARNREVLDGRLEVVRTGKSASIRAIVPNVDRFGELSLQVEAVRAGLSAACRLLDLSVRVVSG
jgi:hypothetical protein